MRKKPDDDVRKSAAGAAGHRYVGSMSKYHVFQTEIGWAGIAWGEQGLIGAHLPERDPEYVAKRFEQRFPGAVDAEPDTAMLQVIEAIRALMRGEKADL